MSERIPAGINRNHIISAINKIGEGVSNRFSDSTGYDVLYKGKRYPPKALVGVAAEELTGNEYGPYDFKGGLKSKCFRILEENGFDIVTKSDTNPFPEEVDELVHFEGALKSITVNKYERDPEARKKCIKHYGAICQVCEFDFSKKYGSIGDGFIHVHHIIPISSFASEYIVNPVKDLKPVCPNCHAMLHKRLPPFSITELKEIIRENA